VGAEEKPHEAATVVGRQSMQLASPSEENLPRAHAAQSLLPEAEYVPGEHNRHESMDAAPGALVYLPAAQSVQVLVPEPTVELHLPTAQSLQVLLLEPTMEFHWPARQLVQKSEIKPTAELHLPATQSVQVFVLEPTMELHLPLSQSVHVSAVSVLLTAVLNRPA